MADPSSPLYKVVYSDYQIRLIRALGDTAADRGLGDAYVEAVKSIHNRMSTDPLAWGDPQNWLQYLRLMLYHGTHDLLHVFYAVDKQRRLVYVREIKPFPGRGLDDVP